jgi:hypothetical protein
MKNDFNQIAKSLVDRATAKADEKPKKSATKKPVKSAAKKESKS